MVGLSEGDKRRLLAQAEVSWRLRLELKVWRPLKQFLWSVAKKIGEILQLMALGSLIAIGYETTKTVIRALQSLI